MSEKKWRKWARWAWRSGDEQPGGQHPGGHHKDGPQKTRCIHCQKPFRTAYGFHLACKSCRTEEDYLRSFEWALALSGAKS